MDDLRWIDKDNGKSESDDGQYAICKLPGHTQFSLWYRVELGPDPRDLNIMVSRRVFLKKSTDPTGLKDVAQEHYEGAQ